MLLQALGFLLLGYGVEKKNGRVGRRKIPYILREGILENSEKYRLNCLKSMQPIVKKRKNV